MQQKQVFKNMKIISQLKENEVFVFGSNEAGIHGAGAAYQAYREFGAELGVGFGHRGKSFAIPTKDWEVKTLNLSLITFYVSRFISYTQCKPQYTFLVTEIGCGLAGYTPEDIAPLFKIVDYLSNKNIILPESFVEVIKKLRNG
jgi:hypothetical protein